MAEPNDEAALVSDAYIDTLLSLHAHRPVAAPTKGALPEPGIRHAIDVLAQALPRFHPSFAFEEELAARLRQAPALGVPSSIVALLPPDAPVHGPRVDRRVVLRVGGAAIASGVSVAAVYAWRQAARRGRAAREVLA